MAYRQLAPMLRDGTDRQRLLDACETTMKRLATDPEYFAKPERFLFIEVRRLFGIGDQLQVRLIIDLEIATARRAIEAIRVVERHCVAFTRNGRPCRRLPPDDGRYCPSHKHLDEVLGSRLVAV